MIFTLLACLTEKYIDPTLSIPDVNSTSRSFGEMVSLQDYEQMVSAWYFGHAT